MSRFLRSAIIAGLCCYSLVGLSGRCHAQSDRKVRVTGLVTDATDGKPLPGANLLIKGSLTGTSTDAKGAFSLDVPTQATLVVSSVGSIQQEIPVGNQTSFSIALSPDQKQLSEVVVVGYGTQNKRDVAGSIGSVSGQTIRELPITSVEQGLQGRLPGVQITQGNASPGGAISIRIRGGNTVLGGNNPLYVIDGFPVYSSPSADISQGQPSNPLASINPNDVESIEVLKDASATAIYGARGANGVVIITTKRGKSGQSAIDFETYQGVQTVRKKLDLLNSPQYMTLANERATNQGTAPPYPDPTKYPTNTDWQSEIFRNAPLRNYSLAFSGGTETNRYLVSGNYFDQQGVVVNSGYKRGAIRLNLDNKLNRFVNLSTSVTAASSANKRTRNGFENFNNNTVYLALVAPPISPVRSADGSFYRVSTLPTSDPAWNNPLGQALGSSNNETTNRVLANANLTFTLVDGLTFSVRAGVDYADITNSLYLNRDLIDGAPGGKASLSKATNMSFLNENIINYTKLIRQKHSINATAGYTWQQEDRSSLSAGAESFATDVFQTDNLGAGSIIKAGGSNREQNTLLSWLGRVNYVFNDKYLLTISGRADGSSRFGAQNKWGFFPSAAIAWRLSEEAFLKNVAWLSNLKLRTSYGVTGNQEIGNYQSLQRLSATPVDFGLNQALAIGYAATAIANPDLKWETTAQYDAGIDVGLFNNRLTITADYYQKNTRDLLAQVPVALSSGFSSVLINSGRIANQGIELGVDAVVVNAGKLRWNVGANFSRNRNKVEKLAVASGEFLAGTIGSPISAAINIVRQGEPLSAFYGYLSDGLWDTDQGATSLQPNARAGSIRYKDTNKDGVITPADRVILGNPIPTLYYGFNSSLTYGPFDLSVLVQGVGGGKLFNANNYSIADVFARGSNQLVAVEDRWKPDTKNVNAAYPRAGNTSPLLYDKLFEDSSYLRLKNIQIGYNLPVTFLKIPWIRTIRLYASGQNLLTITKYTGFDPEASSTSDLDLRKGIDAGAYPSAKTYLLGLKAGF